MATATATAARTATATRADPRTRLRIDVLTELPPHLTEMFRDLYRESFAGMERRAAARQSLTDEEFVEDMNQPSVVKWLCWVDDEPAALMFMTNDLELLPWISPAYYAEKFPEHHARKAIQYYGGLVVHPDHRNGAVIKTLLAAGIRDAARNNSLVAFDCCAFNVDTTRLPEMIHRIATRGANVQVVPHEIDVQRYYAYEFSEAS